MGPHRRIEALVWSIALPGFGQILNGYYIKGIILLTLEFLVNVRSHLNDIIVLSFKGEIQQAITNTNYQWLMFYPCLYMFAMWDAYEGNVPKGPFTFIPFASAAFSATLGLIYSPTYQVFGVLLGPVWLAMAGCFIGLGLGWGLKKVIVKLEYLKHTA